MIGQLAQTSNHIILLYQISSSTVMIGNVCILNNYYVYFQIHTKVQKIVTNPNVPSTIIKNLSILFHFPFVCVCAYPEVFKNK